MGCFICNVTETTKLQGYGFSPLLPGSVSEGWGPVPSRALLCLVLITSSDHRVLLTEITFLRFSPPDNIDEDNIRHQIFIAACFVSICVAKSVPGSESSSFIHRLIITISCKYLVIITILGRFVYFLQP